MDEYNNFEEKLYALWQESFSNTLNIQPIQENSILAVIGSTHSGKNLAYGFMKKQLMQAVVIELPFGYIKQIEAIEEFWKFFTQRILEIEPDAEIDMVRDSDPHSNLINIIRSLTKKKPLNLLISDFHNLQTLTFEKTILDGLESIFKIPNLYILLTSEIYPSGKNLEEDFPFQANVKKIYLSEITKRDHLRRAIMSSYGMNFSLSTIDAIIDIAGKEPLLVEKICSEVYNQSQNENRTIILEEDITKAAQVLINNIGPVLFKEQWLFLTYIEQIVLMIMALSDLVRASVDDLHEQLISATAVEIETTLLEIDFTIALNLLWRRSILYYDNNKEKYSFNNELLRLWLTQNGDLRMDRDLARIISKEFAAFCRNLSDPENSPTFNLRLEQAVLNKSLPLSMHIKEKLFNDLSLELHQNYLFQTPVILHISDIQFGKVHAFDEDQGSPSSLCSVLLADIFNNYEKEHLPRPNIIIISGDIANTGMPNEYVTAINMIDKLASELRIDMSQIIVVPGNHDVNYLISHGISHVYNSTTSKYEKDSLWRESHLLYRTRMAPYEIFINEIYAPHRLRHSSVLSTNQYRIHNLGERFRTLIVGFDSCGGVDHESRNGVISEEDLLSVEREVAKLPSNMFLYKIAVWHHNINSIEGRDDFLTNWSTVRSYLFNKHNYQIALHGHIHTPEDRYQPYDINKGILGFVFGAGAIGVEEKERAGDSRIGHMPLSYNLIQLGIDNSPEKAKLIVREARPRGKEPIDWQTAYEQKIVIPNLTQKGPTI